MATESPTLYQQAIGTTIYKLLTIVSSVDPDEDLRPDWIKRVIFDVHFLHFACILFLIVVVAVVAISLLTEPIPEECVSAPNYLKNSPPSTWRFEL